MDFYRENSTYKHLLMYNSDFYHKNPSCLISKCTTRISTAKIRLVNLMYNSDFSQKFELFNFQINNSDFGVEIPVVCVEMHNSDFFQ